MSNSNQLIRSVVEGRSRAAVLHGDCIIDGRSIPDGVVDAVIVDPPYGMNYRGLENRHEPLLNDERPFIWFLPEAFRVTREGGALVCFCTWKMQEDFRRSIELAGFHVASQIIWDKQRPGMGNTRCTFAPRHEVAWFATKGRFSFPDGRQSSVIPHGIVPPRRRVHTTQKPIELMADLVRAVTPAGGLVFDPCCGSGSTAVAAVTHGYRCIAMDLDERNVRNARERVREALAAQPKPRTAPSVYRATIHASRGRVAA